MKDEASEEPTSERLLIRPLGDALQSPGDYGEIIALVGSLAHEIKNPLSTIRMNMDLVAEDLEGASTPRERRMANKVSVVRRECQRLQSLLEDFLSFARLRSFDLEPVSLNALVRRLVDLMRPQLKSAGVEVREYLDPDLPAAMLDAEKLHGALINLVLNAIQAMPEGGQLVLRTRSVPGGVALDLIDSGMGMDEAVIAKAFDAFYSTKPGGSGLGLPTTKKIVEAHGGRIAVASQRGVGTQITLEFPDLHRLPTAE